MTSALSTGGRQPLNLTWSFADRVRKVRREMRMSQEAFANLTGYKDRTIAAWETARNVPDLADVAPRLEATTGVAKEWWLGWSNNPAPQLNSGWRNRRLVKSGSLSVNRPIITGSHDLQRAA
jgi:transcriptional regulator with XRE-family HTH domain